MDSKEIIKGLQDLIANNELSIDDEMHVQEAIKRLQKAKTNEAWIAAIQFTASIFGIISKLL